MESIKMKNTIQDIEEAVAIQSELELNMVDNDISVVLKGLPQNSIPCGYPTKLQIAKSLSEIVPLLRTLVKQIKKSNENAKNRSDG